MGEAVGEAVSKARAEAVSEARAQSLVGEAVVGESGESGESVVGTPGGGVAHRGHLLESDADAAAPGVFDGLFGFVIQIQVVAPQAATGRSQGGEIGGSTRDRRTWPRSTRRTMEGSIAWMGKWEGVVCAFVSECRKFCGPSKEYVRKGNVFAF